MKKNKVRVEFGSMARLVFQTFRAINAKIYTFFLNYFLINDENIIIFCALYVTPYNIMLLLLLYEYF